VGTHSINISAIDGQFSEGQTNLLVLPGDGVDVKAFSVVDTNHLNVTLNVSADAPGTKRDIFTSTGTEAAFGEDLIDIFNPQVVGVAPREGFVGTINSLFLVEGQDIPFDASTQLTFSSSGITIGKIEYDPQKPDEVKTKITIASDAPLGLRNLTVNAGGMEITVENAFRVNLKPPLDEDGGCSCGRPSGSLDLLLFQLLTILMIWRWRRKRMQMV
jgi:hypothetical protein